MRLIVPPTGNETISMLKNTSLVSVLAFPELLYAAQLIYSDNFKTIPLLLTASLWYLIVTSVLSAGQYFLEQHFSKGSSNRSSGMSLRRLGKLQKREVACWEPQQQRPVTWPSDGRGPSSAQVLRARRGAQRHRPAGAPGEVMTLLGPSGSGKTTFLRLINHLETINAGRLYVDGELVGYSERKGGFTSWPSPMLTRRRARSGWCSSSSTSSRT